MEFQREVRLGIVLYGGVSLAVYENGVAQELYRAIRSEGVYGLLKELIDSDVVVDIISGTSAGGVNGIMLAHALANKRHFAPSAELWRNQGDIQALLRSADDPVATSILNSDYYQEKLADCFENGLASDPSAPEIDELDLFITGTDANGDVYTVYDDQGHAIDVKNHRALFKLAVRKGGRKNDLERASAADLAKLARITSCFPAAFEPVLVDQNDPLFFNWGKLRRPAVYMDGGILNNKPFTSTIDAINRRTANRDVERFLIYVEPDPEVFVPPPTFDKPHSPSMVQAAMSALLSIPGYQSIAADLESIEQHNERAGQVADILGALPDAPAVGSECLDRSTVVPDGSDGCNTSTYTAARFVQIRDTAVGGILNDDNGRGLILSLEDRRSGRILVESFDQWHGDSEATLQQYDIFFRRRRTAHLSQSLMRRVKARRAVPPSTWDVVNHYYKLYEMTEWALISWLNQWKYDWKRLGSDHPSLDLQPLEQRRQTLATISAEVWGQVESRLQSLLRSGIEVPIETTPDARAGFYAQLAGLLKSGPAAAASEQNLLDAIDAALRAALKALGDDDVASLLRREFCRFLEVDRQIFPIQIGSGFESTDAVRVVRFSPRDAQRGLSKGSVSQKVCGSTLGAFGGFFKKSWRANDIMIGRFDSACLLIECLLTKERLAALPAGRTFDQAKLKVWFPNVDASTITALEKTINDYLEAPRDATPVTWNNLIEAIVSACHHEIQLEEWPRVIKCALEQEYAWSRYRRNQARPTEPFDRQNLVWNRAKAKPDQVLADVAAHAIAAGQIPPFTPGAVAGHAFLEEIPDTVLEELSFQALVRTGKSLLASIPNAETRKKVEGNWIYQWPFGRVAPLLYRWARMRRTQPDSVIIFNTAVPAAAIAILLVDATLLLFGVHGLSWRLWVGLIASPLALLIVWGRWFRE